MMISDLSRTLVLQSAAAATRRTIADLAPDLHGLARIDIFLGALSSACRARPAWPACRPVFCGLALTKFLAEVFELHCAGQSLKWIAVLAQQIQVRRQ